MAAESEGTITGAAMARILELPHETAAVRGRYLETHRRIFGFSLPRVLAGLAPRPDYAACGAELGALVEHLARIRTQDMALPEAELTPRGREPVRTALLEYLAALSDTIAKLQLLCTHLCLGPGGAARPAGTSTLRRDRIAYDDSIQAHKRLGARLSQVFSTY